jgi:DNA repair protein RadC
MTDLFKQTIREVSLVYNHSADLFNQPKIKCSEDAYNTFRSNWDDMTINLCETFKIMLLDNSNHCLGISEVSKGGITSTVVDQRLVFATALKANATAIILAHNHPSQGLKPSDADIHLTKKFIKSGKLLDIKVLDHIILTDRNYTSMADECLTPF